MFMKSGLQHEISAGRFLSLWGLSLVPPPILQSVTTTEQLTARIRTNVEKLKISRPKRVILRILQFPLSRGFTVNFD